MRTTKVALAAGLLGASLSSPALADVFVIGSLDKTKDVTISETIIVDKVVTVGPVVTERSLTAAAEAMAIANIRNHDNYVGQDVGDLTPLDNHIQLEAVMISSAGNGSGNGNHGFVGINQDVGVGVNQGNLVSFGFTDEGEAFVNAQASADQKNEDNQIRFGPTDIPLVYAPVRLRTRARMLSSVLWNEGIVGVNQNSGFLNNQTNALSVAAAVDLLDNCDCAVALAEADLGQEVTGNVIQQNDAKHHSEINGSINNNTGVTLVNQSSGNVGNQGNVYAINAALTSQLQQQP